jgi:uncharacterized membrane protein
MNVSDASAVPRSSPNARLLVATGLIVLITFLGDFLFLGHAPGVSVGIFFALLGTAIFAFGYRTVRGAAALVLLMASAIQSGIELCLSNIVVLVALLLVLFGESKYRSVSGLWARSSEAAYAIIRGPFRWGALLQAWADPHVAAASSEHFRGPTLARAIIAATPAILVGLFFAILLSAGNAVLASCSRGLPQHVSIGFPAYRFPEQ